MSDDSKPLFKTWELMVSLPIVASTIAFIAMPGALFEQASRDWLSEDTLIFFAVALTMTLVPALGLLSKKKTTLGPAMKVGAIFFGILLLGVFFAAGHPRVRYQVFRSDCIGMQKQITMSEMPRKELHEELVDPNIGPYIAKDVDLLKHLTLEHGTEFFQHPRAARVALANLKALGLSIDDIQQGPQGQQFLEVALVGEAETEPWKGLDWIDASKTKPVKELGFSAGLFTKDEAQKVVDKAVAQLQESTQDTYENLLATMMSFSGLISKTQGDEILASWTKNLGERAEILEPGTEIRAALCEILKDTGSVKVSYDLKIAEYLEPEDVKKKNLDVTFKRSVLGLIRSTGVQVEETPAAQADLQIAATLEDMKLYEYQRNIYESRSTYVPNSRTRRIGRSSIRVGSTQTKNVVVGTETAIKRGPGFSLTMKYKGKTYDTEMAVLYWYLWVVVNDKKPDFKVLNNDGTYGRLWPFGINEDLLRPYRAP